MSILGRRAWFALPPLLLVAGFVAWRTWRSMDSAEPFPAVPLTALPGAHRYPSFSPDGNHVTFTWTGPKQDNQDVYVQQVGSGTPLRRTSDPRMDYNPVWSPDGRWIAFLRRQWEAGTSELLLIRPLAGTERKVGRYSRKRHLLHPSAVPDMVSGQQVFGYCGVAGRRQARSFVRASAGVR